MLQLVECCEKYKKQLFDMMDEWTATDERIVPWSIARHDYKDFEGYLADIAEEKAGIEGLVPATTLFCLDTERDIFVGAVNIRHYLNEGLLATGGHIGDGIRPTERRRGFATQMIALALEECRRLNIDKVLMTCDEDNIGSAKSIIKNNGIFESNAEKDGKLVQRYWIDL